MANTATKLETTMSDVREKTFFDGHLRDTDKAIAASIYGELERQQSQIELIASENIASRAVLEANGCVMTNKYAEGYPGKRYYGGCEHVDEAESLAIERAKELFNCKFVNVQPHSGASANLGVMFALVQPGDTILGMSLASGGHLTHGAAPALSGKWFNAVQYGVQKEDGLIDYDQAAALAKEHQPKLIICGASAYPRVIDWKKFRDIADSVGALLFADIAHYAGLVAAGEYPSPLPYADIVTTTTHKTLRGPSGGMIMSNSEEIGKKINSSVFPGIQGKPLSHVVAAKAVAFGEALKPSFKTYIKAVKSNCKVLAEELLAGGLDLVSGGTDCHLVLVDLRPKKLTGKVAEAVLERAGMTCNKNAIPYDPESPFVTSGVRLGTPAGTTRGFGEAEFRQIGKWIVEVLDGYVANGEEGNATLEKKIREEVRTLCAKFPIYDETIV